MTKPLKKKKCRQCKGVFTPWNSLQFACTPKCALAYTKAQEEKKAARERKEIERIGRKELRERKEALKTVQDLTMELQPIFNKFIRLRDKDLPCISCGTMDAKFDAGHYFSCGAYPNLRFWESNTRKQCFACNAHHVKGGNLIEYRFGLIARFGKEWVEEFEAKALAAPPANYTRDQLREMKKQYRQKIRELEREM